VSDAAATERAHTHAVTERRVLITPAGDGMAELWALLPAEGAATVNTALDAMAYQPIHHPGGDGRTADQRRADALIDLAINALDDGAAATSGDSDGGGGPVRGGARLARGHGQRPAIQVTVAASTLMGLDDQPGELDGYGPITAGMARRIATDPTATWRRLLTDDHGHVQAVGRRTYRPPADMAATVIARDQHCTFPGCRKKAQHADLDHVDAYRPGDLTTTANLMALCRRHHRLKHTGRRRVQRDDHTGITTWTDPHGRTHPSRPPDRPTTTTTTTTATTTTATTTTATTTTAIGKAQPPTDPDPPPF
jgi:hypothetical protein